MRQLKNKMFLLSCGAVLLCDQISKILVRKYVPLNAEIYLTSFLNLVHIENTGAAFGILGGLRHNLRIPLFYLISLTAMGVLIWFLFHLPERKSWSPISIGFIFGGAIGNLIDRSLFHQVTDFIDLHYKNSHWPAFNIADTGITIGCIMLFIQMLFEERKRS